MRLVVRNVKEAKELFTELSETMECGGRVRVMIGDVMKIHEYVELVIRAGLSLIDIEEISNDYYLVIENRFGRGCEQDGRGSIQRVR